MSSGSNRGHSGGKKRHPKGKGCWYYETVWACALCTHADIYRERRWGRKPKDPRKRGEFHETACSGHFL